MMEYKGYYGVVKYDDEAEIFHGDVLLAKGAVTFQGRSVKEIKQAFQDSVDEYLKFCEESGIEAEKPFSGKLVLRMNPKLHRALAVAARREHKSLNTLITDKLAEDFGVTA
ncbi:type II toxin-antitoxin system HicB family antitoxin [Sulfurirhabdus autotrophica]|uniref:Putative HicB family RNase H-like nuclease n=1 Tax=Sulfurirhabdus autotrophica TaxID=1706046 RepID=A0A4R3Y877_9PROT|nr:type II toxin-antitoxin system HicB family antitoxin [Sulfurirhabdus autotrophica]TCV88050.1 putative HicB family RNase H-like nuclease [Sulfurirhabdus autotrophica]